MSLPIPDPLLYKTLEEVHRRMDACRLCLEGGYEITPPAIYAGTTGAKMMIVGQAPGITEVRAGRPFNAGSGSRLFKWLAEAGIQEDWFRAKQYMTAMTKCYPGRAKGGSGDRVPSRAEQMYCRPYLLHELALVRPELILPVGRLAIEFFYPDKPALDQIIGTEKRLNGAWVIPLPHPSGASRWHQREENRALVGKAIAKIAVRYRDLYPE